MDREIKIYTAKSTISRVFYGITLCLLVAKEFYDSIVPIVPLAFLIGLCFDFYAVRKAKHDERYRKLRTLKYDDRSISLSKLYTYDFNTLRDISYENGRLVLKSDGLPVKYDVYDSEEASINDLIDCFRSYKRKQNDSNYIENYEVSYSGKTMYISLNDELSTLDRLLNKIKNIEKQLVIDRYVIRFPNGETEEYDHNPLLNVCNDIHNKLLNLTPGGAS